MLMERSPDWLNIWTLDLRTDLDENFAANLSGHGPGRPQLEAFRFPLLVLTLVASSLQVYYYYVQHDRPYTCEAAQFC